MRKINLRLLYLCIIILLVLSACAPKLTITLPPDDPTAIPAIIQDTDVPEDVPEDIPEPIDTTLEDLLKAGTAMKWFDDGYLVFVPKGEVSLGDNEYENNPVHNVMLDDFWMYMFKVTNGQYRQCIATGACTPPASEEPYPDLEDPLIKDHPVIGVTWEQADNYCKWMNGRLPTEAEWEKAARGPQANTFPWGEEDPDCDLLNYGECEDPAITKVYEFLDGRSFYQAFDLAGNTYEWVFDLYEDDFISQLPGEEPAGPPDGTERSVRGSSYISEEELIPSAQLFYLEPEKYRTDLGFRCVLGEAEPQAFAHPCVKTVSVPGLPAPWQQDPQGGNLSPLYSEATCKSEFGATPYMYCSDQSLQHGGLDLEIFALGSSDVYVKSINSNQAVYCALENDPIKCFGPEGAAITFEICATCIPPIHVDQVQFSCGCFYELSETNPPTCIYNGGMQVQGETCPFGFVHDQVKDICVKVVQINDECPTGYAYNPDTDCCTATYADPAPDPDKPSDSFLLCPPGAGPAVLVGEWVVQGQYYGICQYLISSPDVENCFTETYYLGECREPPKEETGCTNPGSYTNKTSCLAAACKWVPGTLAAPYCTMP